ncbi:MAG: lysine--tRNA ligase, partial [Parcubacteria group bacterium]|nr:lysine--tRNA ligase [Parcubacteria group bacterium]
MPETPSSPLADERETRLKRLEKIRASGVDPYPAKCRRTKYNQEILSGFESLSASQEVFFIAGRMMELRVHGGSAFANLEDETGKVQIYFKKDVLGEQYALTGSLDIGDFLEVEGTVFKTKQGEITVLVKNFVLLAKALRNLPSQWYGLKDVEERYRRRYVDLIVNKDVRDLFRLQSRFIQAFRNFYLEKDFLEARTPVLENIPGGAEADPFITHHNALDADFYLRISLELHLKRLMVGGYEKIFEIGPVFRNEGMDTQHLQEFTMLESYEAYRDLEYLIGFVEELYSFAIARVFGGLKLQYRGNELDFTPPWPRLDYYELVQKYSGIDLSKYDSVESLSEAVKKKKLDLRLEGNEGMGRVIDKLYKK